MRSLMGKFVIAALAVMLIASVAAAKPADDVLRKNEVSFLLGVHRFSKGQRVEDHMILRAALGRYLSPRVGVESHATLALTSPDPKAFPGEGGSVRTEALIYGLDLSLYLWPQRGGKPGRKFLPYLTGGVGGASLLERGARRDRAVMANAGIGTRYVITSRITFNAVLRIFSSSVRESAADGRHRIRIDSFMTGASFSI